MELLEFVGLAARHEAPATHLSYGEQRLIEIARALALSPRVLLLDEPLVGMNPAEVDHVVGLFTRMRDKGLTMLLVPAALARFPTVRSISPLEQSRRASSRGDSRSVAAERDASRRAR